MKLRLAALWFLAAFGICVPALAEQASHGLDIVTAQGTRHFSVEVAKTDAEREKGLMFRKYLPQNHGMFFSFAEERPIVMWMKNTYIPLDIIFIDNAGKIVHIAEDTEPMSERYIPSESAASGVLEVNAGTAAKLGLHDGDQVNNLPPRP